MQKELFDLAYRTPEQLEAAVEGSIQTFKLQGKEAADYRSGWYKLQYSQLRTFTENLMAVIDHKPAPGARLPARRTPAAMQEHMDDELGPALDQQKPELPRGKPFWQMLDYIRDTGFGDKYDMAEKLVEMNVAPGMTNWNWQWFLASEQHNIINNLPVAWEKYFKA